MQVTGMNRVLRCDRSELCTESTQLLALSRRLHHELAQRPARVPEGRTWDCILKTSTSLCRRHRYSQSAARSPAPFWSRRAINRPHAPGAEAPTTNPVNRKHKSLRLNSSRDFDMTELLSPVRGTRRSTIPLRKLDLHRTAEAAPKRKHVTHRERSVISHTKKDSNSLKECWPL